MGQTITFNQGNYVIDAPSRPTDTPPTGLVVSGSTIKANGGTAASYLLQNYGNTTVTGLTLKGQDSVASGLNVKLTGVNDANQPSVAASNLNFGIDQNKNDTLLIGTSSSNAVNMGAGNDKLTVNYGSTLDNFNMGTGSDQVVFGGSVTNTSINLGGNDGAIDTVKLSQGASVNGLVITGADTGDVLFIGSTQYNYNSTDNNWININDPNDKKQYS